jgi:putative endonuclease
MPRVFTSKRQKIGQLGESIAVTFLKNHGFRVLERNYTRKWGELDIIAEKDQELHFIEVKAVSREKNRNNTKDIRDQYRPEENMHPIKLRKIYRTIQSYLIDRHIPDSMVWQIDLVCVYLDSVQKQAKVKIIENIVG